MANKMIVSYIPVLHQGYRQLFESNPEYHTLFILNDDLVDSFRPLQKDIRRLKPAYVRQSLVAWNLLNTIEVISLDKLKELNSKENDILMPDEDVCRELANEYLQDAKVSFFPIFLRWDRQNSNASDPVDPDAVISEDKLDKELIHAAHEEGRKSPDIWRRVGALVAKDGKVISKAYNESMPTSHSSWMLSDPRNNYGKGVGIEKSTFMHAEARIIAEAAQKGIKLAGSDMYVTTFPCPLCAMLIANAGIKRLFFAEGYAVLDGKRVLQSRKVELIKVDAPLKTENPHTYVPYPENKKEA